jgi:CBS domain containing-hemolysin-like protein
MDSVLPVLIVALLVLFNGLFVAAEFAIVAVPRMSIERRARAGERAAAAVHHIISDSRRRDRYIATAQIGITVSSLGLGMYGEHALAEWILHRLGEVSLPAWLSVHALASTVAIAVLTYVHIVVGEMVPKTFALQHAERTALWVTPPMLVTQTLWRPLVVALNSLGDQLLRMAGLSQQSPSHERYHTPEELQAVIDESQRAGLLRRDTGRLIRDLMQFGEATAADVMVPRVRMAAFPLGETPARMSARIAQAGHTRYPVFQASPDDVVGYIEIKQLLRLIERGESLAPPHVRPLPIVPDTTSIDLVLLAMKRDATPMALVVDEFGGTAGIVTVSDLFGEVLPSRHDPGGHAAG